MPPIFLLVTFEGYDFEALLKSAEGIYKAKILRVGKNHWILDWGDAYNSNLVWKQIESLADANQFPPPRGLVIQCASLSGFAPQGMWEWIEELTQSSGQKGEVSYMRAPSPEVNEARVG